MRPNGTASVACVIPTHRRPAWLVEALRSALAQTYLPDEVLVVDDEGSEEARRRVDEVARAAPVPDFDASGVRRPGKVLRDPFLAIGGYDPKLLSGQDRDLILRAMRSGARSAAVPERLLEHRDDGPRLSMDARTILPARLRFLARADWFRAHPWRWPAGGKKGGAQFLREIEAHGKRWVRAPEARLLHAPHRSAAFFVARGWSAGADQDWVARARVGDGRRARAGYALRHFARNASRAFARVVGRRREVALPAWQVPAALCLALAHWGATLARQLAGVAQR